MSKDKPIAAICIRDNPVVSVFLSLHKLPYGELALIETTVTKRIGDALLQKETSEQTAVIIFPQDQIDAIIGLLNAGKPNE